MTSPPADLVARIEAELRPLEVELAEAWWESNTRSSTAADVRRTAAELARRSYLADADTFAAVRAARDDLAGDPTADPLLRRQLDVLHDAFVPHQVSADLTLTRPLLFVMSRSAGCQPQAVRKASMPA